MIRKKKSMEKKPRRTKKKKTDENEEKELRAPDANLISRLLTPDIVSDNEEEELVLKAIRESRDEFRRHQDNIRKAQERRRSMRAELDLPISRLRLIQRASTDEKEVVLIDRILQFLSYHTRPDEAEDQSPPPVPSDDMKSYIQRSGRLFHPIVPLLDESI